MLAFYIVMVAVKMRGNKKREQQKTDETSADSGEEGCDTSVVKETSDEAEITAGGEKKESFEERRELVAEPDRKDKETNRDN